MSPKRICKKKYYGISCDGPCCLPEAPAVRRPSVLRWEDLPTLGESVCTSTFGLGKACVLRAGHPGTHCSQTGSEWPVESLAGRGKCGYG